MTLACVKMKSSTSWGDGLTQRRSVVDYAEIMELGFIDTRIFTALGVLVFICLLFGFWLWVAMVAGDFIHAKFQPNWPKFIQENKGYHPEISKDECRFLVVILPIAWIPFYILARGIVSIFSPLFS